MVLPLVAPSGATTGSNIGHASAILHRCWQNRPRLGDSCTVRGLTDGATIGSPIGHASVILAMYEA